ncbi:MAG: PAS-domain containing protein [Gammaproteobacteria bacterium]
MLQTWVPPVVALGYACVLFGVAWLGDKKRVAGRFVPAPVVYSLALGVYCTSWTFFGAVGRAASDGWDFTAIYLGPILVFAVLTALPARMIAVSKEQSITSIADFIASRYGKAQGLAVLASLIALMAVLPYIALQLKAVAGSYAVITGRDGMHVVPGVGDDTALLVAGLLAVFSILFGTRHVDTTESHRGMVLAIAFESAVKLVAFLAVGLYVMFGLFDGPGALVDAARADAAVAELYSLGSFDQDFLVHAGLAILAILCLPRQFHVTVVENTGPRDLAMARWAFPAYLGLFTLFVAPIAVAGVLTQGAGTNADSFVLTLPLENGAPGIALLAFLGGFSAATGMVIVGTISCATMLCNEVVMPALVKFAHQDVSARPDLVRLLKRIRRVLIVLILALAWLVYRTIGPYGALASIGLLSFVLAAQFGPALIGGLYWRRATRAGALAGLAAGSVLWTWTLLIPAFAKTGWLSAGLMEAGPFGLTWLAPYGLFGLTGMDPVIHGTLWSLGLNLAFYVGVSLYTSPRLLERRQAAAFVGSNGNGAISERLRGSATAGDLLILAERFIGRQKAASSFRAHLAERGLTLSEGLRADVQLVALTERLLSGAMGATAARMVMASALKGAELQLEDVASIMGETSQASRFNRDLIESTLENVAEGISVVDADLRLVAWNRRYAEFFRYPPELLTVGMPLANLIRHNARRGLCGPGDPEDHVAKRIEHLRRGGSHVYQRVREDGTVLQMRVNPMPGGGFVASFSDITELKRIEEALRESERSIRIYTDNVPVLIAYVDRELVYRFVNKAYERSLGLSREDICGRRVDEVLGRQRFLERESHMEAALEGARQSFEVETRDANGEVRFAEATYIPEFDDSGAVQGFFAIFHDISERRRAEQGLKKAFDTLEQRVEERTRELSGLNRRLRGEIELRSRIERALRDAKAEAEGANLSKTRFLAAASHDLLQPLNAARLFTSALGQRDLDEKAERAVDRIDSSLRAAEDLLTALLDISKLDAGALEPQVSVVRLEELLVGLGTEFGALARERDIRLDTVPCRLAVHSDRQFLRRILQNFLSNALRYTREGRVLLGCRRRGEYVSIQVLDTGPGIPEEHLEDVFEEFRRLHPKDEQGAKGLGLGLAIVERMARALGHRVEVKSVPGRGSMFSVLVPVAAVEAAAGEEQPRSRSISVLEGALVLCVDNQPSTLEGMAHLLEGWGCQVLPAASTAEAIAAVDGADRTPDLVLADYHLEGGDTGLATLAAIRELWGDVPSAVITADHGEVVREEVRQAGCPLLRKPLKPAALRAVMSQMVTVRRQAS